MRKIWHRFGNFLRSPVKIKLAVSIGIIYLIVAQNILFIHVYHHLSPENSSKDIGLRYEKRFVELRSFLPSRGILGYVSDTGIEHFLRSQYVLAPIILTRSPGPRLIVANYSQPSVRPPLLYGKPYVVLKEFTNGVALLKMDD